MGMYPPPSVPGGSLPPPSFPSGPASSSPSPSTSGPSGGPRRRRRAGSLLATILVALLAGGVGAFLGVRAADETDTVSQPSRREVQVSDASVADSGSSRPMDVGAVLDVMEPSVVTISSTVQGGGASTGTGVVLTADGEILTNAHVVEGATAVRVRFAGEVDPRPATVLAADTGNDLALLRVDVDGLTPAVFAKPDSIKVGDEVIAIGYALNLDGDPSVTRGIISATDRTLLGNDGALDGLLQTDAAISSGNSGGPLINANAEVVGINTAVYRSDAMTAANNVGFAISVDEALPIIEELRAQSEGDKRVQGFLGVGVNDRDDGGQGAIISEVTPGSPADEAGLRAGDVVLEVDGSAINGSAGLIAAIRDAAPGDDVTIVVQRDGERVEVTATLTERESS